MIYFDFCEKTKKNDFFNVLVFYKNQTESLQIPLFSDFSLTHTDVFFDEESESDLIFNKKLTPKG